MENFDLLPKASLQNKQIEDDFIGLICI